MLTFSPMEPGIATKKHIQNRNKPHLDFIIKFLKLVSPEMHREFQFSLPYHELNFIT